MDNQQAGQQFGREKHCQESSSKVFLSLSLLCLGCPTYTMGWTSPPLGSLLLGPGIPSSSLPRPDLPLKSIRKGSVDTWFQGKVLCGTSPSRLVPSRPAASVLG